MRVAKAEEIPPGQSGLVTVDGKEVAVFNVDGVYYAVGNRCPHRSGPLFKGKIEKVPLTQPSPQGGEGKGEGETLAVRCPLHGWLFELGTGRSLTRPGSSVPVYPASCEEGEICLGAAQGQAAGPTVQGEVPAG